MKRVIIILPLLLTLLVGCSQTASIKADEARDGLTNTSLLIENNGVLEFENAGLVSSYKVWSSDCDAVRDPKSWELSGSNDGSTWTLIDSQNDVSFCARYQDNSYSLDKAVEYSIYRLSLISAADSVSISEIALYEKDINKGWDKFPYPIVTLKVEDDSTKGAMYYNKLVQNVDEYVKYHTQKVCQILHFSQEDELLGVDTIKYTLSYNNGISAKSGAVPTIGIVYSTKHCEKVGDRSLYELNDETRGVLFHELTHAYQYEPKNCGSYNDGGVFWAQIEGLADAVRTEAGLFDVAKLRKQGGNWMDGYKTTGFFLHWLKTKDSDAIRKFHASARDLETWSFDGAMVYIFGEGATTQKLWDEYQVFIAKEKSAITK